MIHISIFLTFLRLGCTSFGGPVAHLGYFREEFVARKQWLTEVEYANLIALCQFIPGPASSQVGAAIGYSRGGYFGAFSAWVGFTLPSAIIMLVAAISLLSSQGAEFIEWMHGLKLVAVAIVAQAVWGMQRQLCSTLATRLIALFAVILLLTIHWPFMQLVVIFSGLVAGTVLPNEVDKSSNSKLSGSKQSTGTSQRIISASLICLFILGLVALPLLTSETNNLTTLFDKFYRSGALVFGGGHVVLPLLLNEFVPSGLVGEADFFIGYGAAQALPGPLFTFATFLGAATSESSPFMPAIIATTAIFIPGMLLLFAVLPYWQKVSKHKVAKRCLKGVNAAVVGLLLAALIDPIITTSISTLTDIAIVLIALIALVKFKLHPLWVIMGCLVCHGLVVIL